MELKNKGWLLVGFSWIALLLSVLPTYSPLVYSKLVQDIFSVAIVLFVLGGVYLIAISEQSQR